MDSRILQKAGTYLLTSAPLFCLVFDGGGQVVDANPYTRNLLGGDPCRLRVEDVFLAFAGPVDLVGRRAEAGQGQLLSVATASGQPESFLFSFLPVGDDTLVVGGQDPDDSERLRRELLELNGQLNGLTRELQKRNHQLAELNTLKNQFLGMAAHDLRKPVNALLSYSEFLLDEAASRLDPEHLDFLRIIHSSTDLMRRLIDGFLDISLIESGHFHMNFAQVAVGIPVARSMALQRIMAQKRGISLDLVDPGGKTLVKMDEYKIEQVLNNLIANAIEHAPEASTVLVRIAPTAKGVVTSVTDRGPGLSDAEAQRLFSPYQRRAAGKVGSSGGSGLGLAISRKIVEAHGGALWIESTPGRGATFSFLLPFMKRVTEESQGI